MDQNDLLNSIFFFPQIVSGDSSDCLAKSKSHACENAFLLKLTKSLFRPAAAEHHRTK